ncbi:MAG: DUF308 domain-containing protein [Betaproteobacteria bacterium]|nr:DUF308 domain-containing protein [Betaproteobacteria bacterium]
MNELQFRNWWMLALRGAIAVLFGVLALAWSGLTLAWLAALFAVFAVLGGGVSIVGAVRNRSSDEEWWLILLLGLLGVGAGLIAVSHLDPNALVLVLAMGMNALATGALDAAVAIRLRAVIKDAWLLLVSGIVSMVFGVLVFLFPAVGVLAMVWLIGLYAVSTGMLLLALALRARNWDTAREASRAAFLTTQKSLAFAERSGR